MATRQTDGSIRLCDGRILYANSLVLAQDLVEIIGMLTPPPAWPFVSGGGGSGSPGPQGPPGPVGPAGPPGPSIDLFAATRIVSNDPTQGTDTTIQGAIDNLPAEGGLIYIKQGTYPQSTTILLPDKPVTIVGSGIDATVITLPAFAGPLFKTSDGLLDYKLYTIEKLSASGGGMAGQSFFAFDDAGGFANAYVRLVRISGFETISNWLKYDLTYFKQSTFFIHNSKLRSIAGGSIIAKTPNPANTYVAAVSFRAFQTTFTEDFTADRWTGDADCDLWLDQCMTGPTFLPGMKFNGMGFRASLIFVDGAGDITFYGNGWDANNFQDGACFLSATDSNSRLVVDSPTFINGSTFFGLGIKVLFVARLIEIRTGGNLGANPSIEIAPPNQFRTSFISGIIGQSGNAGTLIKLTNANGTRINCNFIAALAGQTTIEETGTADFNIGFGCVGLTGGSGMIIIGANSRFVTGTGINIA